MEALLDQHVHQIAADKAVALLGSNQERGLDRFEIEERQRRFGRNAMPVRRGRGTLIRLLLQFHQPLVYILLVSVAITAALREWIDAGVILGVVLVNAIIGFLQEARASEAIEALTRMTITEARVLRAGEIHEIASEELVPGDVVLLQSGDKVPADVRLFRSRDLQIDESALTGESVPTAKTTAPLAAPTPLAERSNMAFSSTLVTYGQGRGVVVATGASTEVGRISELVATADVLQTPLTRKIARFSHVLLLAIVGLAILTFAVGLLRGESVFHMFMAAVALAVAAIPEGLPAAVTITLSIGVARMARRRAIIRRLPAVEALGSTTIICSDKTGTLTLNQMTVRAIRAGGHHYTVSGSGYEAEGGIEPDPAGNVAARACLEAGLLCNDTGLVEKEGRVEVNGDPTEAALLVVARKAGLEPADAGGRRPRLDAIPFESQYQYMATLHDDGPERPRLLYVKGSVEAILQRCEVAIDDHGARIPLQPGTIHAHVDELAAGGLRVLAFARGALPSATGSVCHENVDALEFLGLQAMFDPPRPEAIQAVRACQSAGIRVKMITGDHALTARAVATTLGLDATAADQPPLVLTSRELAEKSDDELIEAADRVAVFARATPEQKLRLVRALQARGHIVAMTGDGVNDAPALRQADIGVAMGVGGTEVAKEAADMILTDDNFATIEAAVEEGRGVFDNLTKFIVWTLPTNVGEGLVILAAIFVGATLPVLPVQILWINMTTGVLLGMTLAFEPKERDIMTRPPREPRAPILSGIMITRICLVAFIMLVGAFGAFNWALSQGMSDAAARTVAVNTFVFVEVFYLFNCRSLTRSMFAEGLFSNLWIAAGVATMIALQLAFTYVPFMNAAFGSEPFGWGAWWRILLTGAGVYAIIGFEKWLRGAGSGLVTPRTTRTRSMAEADGPATPIQSLTRPFVRFLHVEASGGIVLVACTAIALILANSPWAAAYQAFWDQSARIGIGVHVLDYPLWYWVNDGLMTIFFFVIGLEIKREMISGELSDRRKMVLPVVAAVGGALVPAVIFASLQIGRPGQHGWAVPMATDIAFVVGCLSLLGLRVPPGLKIFVLTLAIVDDILAVSIIAVFYTEHIKLGWGVAAVAGFAGITLLNRLGVRTVTVYVLVGAAIWLCTLKSGIHPTVAGVLLGLLTPASAWLGSTSLLEVIEGAPRRRCGTARAPTGTRSLVA